MGRGKGGEGREGEEELMLGGKGGRERIVFGRKVEGIVLRSGKGWGELV